MWQLSDPTSLHTLNAASGIRERDAFIRIVPAAEFLQNRAAIHVKLFRCTDNAIGEALRVVKNGCPAYSVRPAFRIQQCLYRHTAILCGGHTFVLAEYTGKIRRIGVAAREGNPGDALVRVFQQLRRAFHTIIV